MVWMWWTAIALGADPPEPAAEEPELLEVELGKSVLLTLPRTPVSLAVTDPDVATVTTLGTPTTVMVQGRTLGSTDLVVNLGGPDPIAIFDIEVRRDLGDLRRMIEHVTERSYDDPDPDERPPTVK